MSEVIINKHGVRFWNLYDILRTTFNKIIDYPDYIVTFDFFDKRITVESIAYRSIFDRIVHDFLIETIEDYKTGYYKNVISKDIRLDNWLMKYGHLNLGIICDEMEKVIINSI